MFSFHPLLDRAFHTAPACQKKQWRMRTDEYLCAGLRKKHDAQGFGAPPLKPRQKAASSPPLFLTKRGCAFRTAQTTAPFYEWPRASPRRLAEKMPGLWPTLSSLVSSGPFRIVN